MTPYVQPIIPTILLLITTLSNLSSQTVGTIINTSDASQQFTLLSAVNSTDTYLIDHCGHIYNHWSSEYRLGMTAYLDKHGNLYRGGKVDTPGFNAGGKGGVIEKYSWDGDLLWQYRLANDTVHLHHDFELMPNGNLLVVAWEYLYFSEVVSLGRDSLITSPDGFYSEIIIEVNPQRDFSQVWHWRATDHIVQDRNPDIRSFGSTEEHPQLLDINLNVPGSLSRPVDWLHINSIDYNPTADQILLSCLAIDEIIIIDHSTTILESSTSSGGHAGNGGDLIFRWGNPGNYIRSIPLDRQLYKQHDASWIIDNDNYSDRVLLFNNGLNKDGMNYSTVDEIQLKRVGPYNYDYQSNAVDQRKERVWSYNTEADQKLYSKRMSGAIRITSDRTIISESDSGRIIEIDTKGNVLWSYVNPVGTSGIFSQGEIPTANTIFKVASYSNSFFNKTVALTTEFEKIERDATSECGSLVTTNVSDPITETLEWTQFGNTIYISNAQDSQVTLLDIGGKVLFSQRVREHEYSISLHDYPSGMYILLFSDSNKRHYSTHKVLVR